MSESIIVRRHGGRWAVQEGADATPVAEYETLELAEAAARARAGGREVVVQEHSDDEQLGRGGGFSERGGAAGSDAGIDQRTGGGGSGRETPREPQAGL